MIFQCDSTNPLEDCRPAGLAAIDELLQQRKEWTALLKSFSSQLQ